MFVDVQWDMRSVRSAVRRTEQDMSQFKDVYRKAADIVRDEQKARAPYLSGDLYRSIKSYAYQTKGLIRGGRGTRAPHFIVNEFGGTIPRWHSKHRTRFKPRKADGYFFYPSLEAKQPEVTRVIQEGMAHIVRTNFP